MSSRPSQDRTPFRSLHHICIVVRDIERSIRYYESIGIGPWQDYPPLSEYTQLSVPNVAAFLAMRYKVCDLANVQLQLCQPADLDCPQRRFLDSHGEGVFHIGFEGDLDGADGDAAELGLKTLMSGRRPDNSGFTYFDTQDDAGVTLLVRRTSR